MVSRVWLYVFSVVVLPYLNAKSVSLNELIEAEALPSENIPRISKPEFTPTSISSPKLIEAEEKIKQLPRPKPAQTKVTQEKTTKQRTGLLASGLNRITKTVSGTIFSQNKNLSPLHYRKTFEIKSPIKPKRVTLYQRTNRLRNQSGKRDTHQYGAINQKYVPLLRNLGLLFDNILGGDSGENYDYSSEECVCTCVSKKAGRGSGQTAAASARVGVTETPPPAPAPTTTAAAPPPDNVGTVGRHPNVSLLFTRNTTSVWRNNTRVDARSGPPHLGGAARHLTGDSGNDERHTRDGKAEADPENHEEDSYGPVRDDSGDGGPLGGNPRGFVGKSIVSHKFKTTPNKTAEGTRGVPEYEGEIQFEIRTDQAKGARVLPKPGSGLRDAEVQDAVEEGVEYDVSSDKQLAVGDGEDTEENQKLRGSYEGVSLDNMSNLSADPNASNQNDKYVMIYDGYSVARDVNGKNTLTEKAITIHA